MLECAGQLVVSCLYVPRGVHPRILNKLTWELRNRGIWVERHSYSYRVFYGGRIAGSIHIYPGFDEVVVKLYREYELLAQPIISVFNSILPQYRVRVEVV